MKTPHIPRFNWQYVLLIMLLMPVIVIAQPSKTALEMMDDIWLPEHQDGLDGVVELNIRDAVLEKVLDGLTYPWAFEFLNDDEILISEVSGRLLRYQLRDKKLIEISGLPDIANGFPQFVCWMSKYTHSLPAMDVSTSVMCS